MGQRNVRLLAELIQVNKVAIAIFSESEFNTRLLASTLSNRGYKFFRSKSPVPKSGIEIFSVYPGNIVTPVSDERHFTARNINIPGHQELLIIAAHLHSKLYKNNQDQEQLTRAFSEQIRNLELAQSTKRTVIIGDMNMNPFEDALCASDGLNGVRNKSIAKLVRRKYQGKYYEYFYNPSWRLLQNDGTYYYEANHITEHRWNVFDQILIRPDLIDEFDDKELKILTTIGSHSLTKTNGKPDKNTYSDHLPLIATLRIRKIHD